jgi:hypothetical protein
MFLSGILHSHCCENLKSYKKVCVHIYSSICLHGMVCNSVRFEIFTAMIMKNSVFWDVTPCGSCKNRCFGGTHHLRHQGDKNWQARKDVSSNKQPKDTVATWRNIPRRQHSSWCIMSYTPGQLYLYLLYAGYQTGHKVINPENSDHTVSWNIDTIWHYVVSKHKGSQVFRISVFVKHAGNVDGLLNWLNFETVLLNLPELCIALKYIINVNMPLSGKQDWYNHFINISVLIVCICKAIQQVN